MSAPMAAGVPVLRTLNQATASLDRLLTSLSVYSNVEPPLREIAAQIAGAVAQSPDIAVAAVLLNQIGGRYAIRHCVDSAVVAALLAQTAGDDGLNVLTVTAAALTMNAGMLRELDAWQARTSVLSAAEREQLKRHPIDSAELLRSAGIDDRAWIDCVMQHHESHDGSGYPAGLAQDRIAANARLVGMADRYCACVSARNYRRSMLPPAALQTLAEDPACDPAMVALFTRVLGSHPAGTLVRLHDGAVGVLAGAGKVHVLRAADGDAVAPALRDAGEIAAALHEDEAKARFSMKAVWGELAAL